MKRLLPALVLSFTALGRFAHASDAVDTRVTFTIADNDILKGPEETASGSPSIPNFNPEARNRLFFDDYERRDRGFENLTHFVLYAHQPGFFEGIDTEAALVIRAQILDERPKDGVAFQEDGSYITISKAIASGRLAVTAFPISANRFQLGYSYDISWGGSQIFRTTTAVPGLRVQWETEQGYAFVGTKTSVAQERRPDNTTERDTVWGVLAGGGIDVVDELRIEAGGGFFDRGNIDKDELIVPSGNRFSVAPWQAFGGSAQLTYHVGIPIGLPIDFRLYKNDPMKRDTFFRREEYNDELSFLVQSEVSVLGQTLQDLDRPSSTVVQPAVAADLTGRVKYGKLRVHALAVYRTLSFILFNVPSNPNFADFPNGADTRPEVFLSGGLDYYIEGAELTPGVVAGVQFPAYYRGPVGAGNNPPPSLGQQTIVYHSNDNLNDIDILDPGDSVKPVFASKLTGRWDVSEIVSTVGELQVSYDQNRRGLARDPGGIPVRLEQDPFILGFNLMLQARF